MLERIMVPLDETELSTRALGPARGLAERTGVPVVLLTAEWDGNEARARLEDIAVSFPKSDVTVEVVHSALPAAAILEEARPGTVVCMATHGRSGLGRVVVGSVAEAIVQGSDQPVLLVGPGVHGPGTTLGPGALVATVDGSALSELALPVAREWASMLNLVPWLVHAVEPSTSAPTAVDATYVEGMALTMSDDTVRAQWEVLHTKHPADAICDFANRLPASLVVMASHGHGHGPSPIGSVSMNVVHGAPCPVLISGAGLRQTSVE